LVPNTVPILRVYYWYQTPSPSSGYTIGTKPRPHPQGTLLVPNRQHTLKMGKWLVPEKSKTFKSWRCCRPENISLNFVAAKASSLNVWLFIFVTCGLWSTRTLKGKNTLSVDDVIMLRPLNKVLFNENHCWNLAKWHLFVFLCFQLQNLFSPKRG